MPRHDVDKNLVDVVPLPSLKRKRQSDKHTESFAVGTGAAGTTCFTNAAFSSTPKKLIARRRKSYGKEVPNHPFVQNTCLEVKSIVDIVQQTKCKERHPAPPPKNPYEVVRKPPKKKKRETEIVEACFENPALNLELPEKQFNPYEVLRETVTTEKSAVSKCFVNEALNLRTQDAGATRNPFEIHRCSAASALASNPAGVENLGLEETVPTDLKIRLPFKPTVGCRIDFTNLPISELTPSKLLAEKLVFSPAPGPKRSLDSIREESTMDIGKELDRYQLELENSINEAKMRKSAGIIVGAKPQPLMLQVGLEEQVEGAKKLTEIAEVTEEEEQEEVKDGVEFMEVRKVEECTKAQQKVELYLNQATSAAAENDRDEKENSINSFDPYVSAKLTNNADVAYASESDDDFDFKSPAPFMRAYQRPHVPKLTISKESLHSVASSDSEEHKQALSVGNLIRKSIRKLMHPVQSHAERAAQNVNDANLLTNEKGEEKSHVNAYKLIRNSLRRHKDHKQQGMTKDASVVKAEISIIDTSERTMKLKAEVLAPERKSTLRSSIRRSTREVMKSVFHKTQNAYDLAK